MIFDLLKDDKYFQTLFQSTHEGEDFVLDQINVNFQRQHLSLILQTSLLPDNIRSQDQGQGYNKSSFHIEFFFVSEIFLDLHEKDLQTLSFNFKDSTMSAHLEGKSVLKFTFKMVKLSKWDLFLQDLTE